MKLLFLSNLAFVAFVIFIFMPVTALAQQASDADNNRLLYQLINQRLAYMEDVARYKWQHQKPVEDLKREEIVIAKSVSQAAALKLPAEKVTPFFQRQIDLAKKIQRYYHQLWLEQGTPGPDFQDKEAVSLKRIRRELIALGDKIMRLLALSKQQHDFEVFNAVVRHDALDLGDKADIFYALTQVSPYAYSSRLDRIVSEKILYIGTTGDYQPFSFYRGDTLSGIDIALARTLAGTLGARPVFIATSWPQLLTDLGSDKYDIMMSGISKKLFRQQQGLFSDSYHTGGKTPIALCRHKARFDSLDKIDTKETRLIVNRGGTNQRFVQQYIRRAQVRVYEDNTSIFQQILTGNADVMITDKIEVAVQAKIHPELCATMPGRPLSFSAKAFLIDRDLIWLEYINAWLEQVKNDGSLEGIFEQYL